MNPPNKDKRKQCRSASVKWFKKMYVCDVIICILSEFRKVDSTHLICKHCLMSDFASVTQAEAMASLNNVHFQLAFKFILRLFHDHVQSNGLSEF